MRTRIPQGENVLDFDYDPNNTPFKIAVLGSSSAGEETQEGRLAFHLGAAIAERGGIVLTGGCRGLPEAAARGAMSLNGLTIAISPARNETDHKRTYHYHLESKVIIYTGMGRKGRNVILVRSADACIFVGGGMGTLNEFTIAYDDLGISNAIGVLVATGGFSNEYLRLAALCERASRAALMEDGDPSQLVNNIFAYLILQKTRRLSSY